MNLVSFQISYIPLSTVYTASMRFFPYSTEFCQFKILPIALFEHIRVPIALFEHIRLTYNSTCMVSHVWNVPSNVLVHSDIKRL